MRCLGIWATGMLRLSRWLRKARVPCPIDLRAYLHALFTKQSPVNALALPLIRLLPSLRWPTSYRVGVKIPMCPASLKTRPLIQRNGGAGKNRLAVQ